MRTWQGLGVLKLSNRTELYHFYFFGVAGAKSRVLWMLVLCYSYTPGPNKLFARALIRTI